MCGEKVSSTSPMKCLKGSPPRVRGKVPKLEAAEPENGITPACAGKRATTGIPARRRRDHPRVCGEKGGILSVQRDCPRITPACAGKSTARRAYLFFWDHPRMCGEKGRWRGQCLQ